MMAAMACAWSAAAQTRTIHGTVLEADTDEPLIGATIMPVGGGQGGAADIDGHFVLTVPDKVKKATFSYVGFDPQTLDLKDGMVVHLKSSATNLNDVIVVAYGTANKESLTGSVAVVGAKEIEDRPVTSVTAALEGNAPGVQVNNSTGAPGSDPSIRVRGFNSINGSSAPLNVVDGVVYEGSIADLNPQDIESITVLKDAASCALYGNRGANGVILITTKRAKNVGKVDVTLTVRQGIYERMLPFYQRLGANQWMEQSLVGLANGAITSDMFDNYREAMDYYRDGAAITSYIRNNIYGVPNNELYDENGKLIPSAPLADYNDLDWWDAVARKGYRQEYNVNAAAAGEKYNVFASAGYLKEQGYLVGMDFERFNGRIQANFNPVKYLRMGVNLAAATQDSESLTAESTSDVANPFLVQIMAPVYPVYAHNEDGSIRRADGKKVYNTAGYLENNNVAFILRNDKANSSSIVLDGSVYATAVLPYGFEATVRGNLHRDRTNDTKYLNKTMGSAEGLGGLYETYSNYRSHTFMQTINWAHDYGDNHVDVLLDHENQTVYNNGFSVYNVDETFPGVYNLMNFAVNMTTNGGIAESRTESYLGRVRYNYDQRYFGEASIRRDGTSKFSPSNRWGTFWSVGASWVITREKFMQNAPWVDYLKLRAAYGSVGNNASASDYAYWALYAYGPTIDENNTLINAQLAADDLRWEATKTFDIGLDGALFNDRLNFSVGYYDKRNKDLLFNVRMPASAGTLMLSGGNATVTANVGTMLNTGWEIQLSGDIIRNRNFRWSLGIDASFLRNRILKLPYGKDQLGNPRALSEGHSVYEYYLNTWAGVDKLTGNSLYVISTDTRDYMMTDEAGKQVFDWESYNNNLENARADGHLFEIDGKYYTDRPQYATRQFQGSAIPTVYGSFNTSLQWKGLSFSALFTYALGGKTFDTNYAGLMQMSQTAQALHKDVLKSWTAAPAGMAADSPDRIDPNGIPQFNQELSTYNNETYSSRWLTTSSYLTLKNILLSYDLPHKWTDAMLLQNINVGVSIDNLFMVCARKGMNPQASWSGDQTLSFVPHRVYSLQITAKF